MEMFHTPMFSVIVPIYKVEKHLKGCIESILGQTYVDFELILVDDGSPDKCGEICEEYAQRDKRIKVIHKTNGGLVSARKAGILVAKGAYIINVDGDDYIASTMFQEVKKEIEQYTPDMLALGLTNVRNNGTVINSLVNDLQANQLYKVSDTNFCNSLVYNRKKNYFNIGGLIPGVCLKVIKREILQKSIVFVPDEIRNGEDVAITFSTLCSCESVYVSSIHSYFYRQNESSITNTFRMDAIKRQRALFDFMSKNMSRIPQKNIDTYICVQILLRIGQAAKAFEDYRVFKEYVKNEISSDVEAVISRMKIPELCFRHYLLLYLLKHKAYAFLWLIYRKLLTK